MSKEKFLLQTLLTGKNKRQNDEIELNWQNFIFESSRKRAAGNIFSTEKHGISLFSTAGENEFISPESSKIMRKAFSDYRFDLCLYFLEEIARAKKIISPELQPLLLEYCSENPILNMALSRVLGESGRELSALHPVWHTWYGENDNNFSGLGKEQKLLFLKKKREKDAFRAAKFIQQNCADEPSSFKTDWLKFVTSEPKKSDLLYLSEFATDKSPQVRLAVHALLCAQGEEEYVERAEKYFSQCTELFKGKIFLRQPTQCSSEMKRDGFSDKMQPQEWTFRIFSAVSPSFVEKFFGCEGADLLVLLSEAQYADNALSGFAQSLRLRGEKIRAAQFVAALYAQKNKAIFVRDLDLINLLDTEDAEKIAEYFISFLPPDEHYQYHPVGRLITHYSQNWSEKLTQIFVKALRKIFLSEKSPRYGLYWEDETALFAMKAPTEFVPRLLKYFSDEKRYLPYWEKSVGNMRQTWLIRQNFFESFAAVEN